VLGGETTLALSASPGRGGRNQHLAATVALRMAGRHGFALIAAGTDGIDGNSDAAGAIVDGSSVERAQRVGHDLAGALSSFDTATALSACGDAVTTGPTGTNVGDVLVAVAAPR